MKKLFAVTAFGLLSVIGCTKKYCWQCETKRTTYINGGFQGADTIHHVYCDRSEDDMKKDEGVVRREYQWGAETAVDVSVTICTKQ